MSKVKVLTLAAAAMVLTACATPQQVLAPASNVPETCEAIDAEMFTLAESQGQWQGVGTAKDSAVLGVGIAAAAGVLPAGFAWAPLAAMVVQQVRVPNHVGRINYLANVREIRGCEPLNFKQ